MVAAGPTIRGWFPVVLACECEQWLPKALPVGCVWDVTLPKLVFSDQALFVLFRLVADGSETFELTQVPDSDETRLLAQYDKEAFAGSMFATDILM